MHFLNLHNMFLNSNPLHAGNTKLTVQMTFYYSVGIWYCSLLPVTSFISRKILPETVEHGLTACCPLTYLCSRARRQTPFSRFDENVLKLSLSKRRKFLKKPLLGRVSQPTYPPMAAHK